MQEPDNTERAENPSSGEGGAYIPDRVLQDKQHPRSDLKMLRRAIVERWPIRDEDRGPVMERVTAIALDPESKPNMVLLAARCLVDADKLNLKQEERDDPTPQEHIHRGMIGLTAVRAELLNDPGYLDYLRSRAIEEDAVPGAVCPDGEPRQLANGKAPGGLGPGTNGHSNGHH